MFKFLLKSETGLGNPFIFTITILSWFLWIFLFAKFVGKEYNLLSFFLIPFLVVFTFCGCLLIKNFVDKYRTKKPYKVYTIKENNKEIEVREYPILRMKEYYYNGKLHRENGLSVVFDSNYLTCEKHGSKPIYLKNGTMGFFFLNGNNYNYQEFRENLPKVRIQNKALSF
tara:strand:- start:35074 stop:35583 length:510 start_codon:yes stop_codon:yes gene_type:complete